MSKTHIIEYRIGRNIGTEPMSDILWERFIDQARAILDGVASGLQNETVRKLSQWTEVHTGAGTWTAEDGTVVREESAVISLYTDANWLDASTFLEVLEEFAGELAANFSQDAIALVSQGVSTLVPAKQPLVRSAAATRLQYPVGTVVRFAGYEDQVGKQTATFRKHQLLEVVGHDDSCGSDGLLVRRFFRGESGRRGRKTGLVFATETFGPILSYSRRAEVPA